jgi:membrane-associated phospholipid phosphatase
MKFRPLFRVLVAAAPGLCTGIVAPCAVAQKSRSDSASIRAWVTKGDAVAGAFAVAATVAIAPLDGRTARELQERRFQRSDDLQHSARDLAFLGGPGPFIVSGSLFAAGHLTGMPRLADAGLHMTEAVLITASFTGLGKGFFGRALPNVNDSNPDNFQFFRGFHDRNGPFVSFPSGHTGASFAMASVVTAEVDRWHPELARIVGPIAYGGAGLVGLARMYQNVHWASDLPLAAAIGTWSGLTVVARSHREAGGSGTQGDVTPSALVAMLRSTTVVPVAGRGKALMWSVPFDLR